MIVGFREYRFRRALNVGKMLLKRRQLLPGTENDGRCGPGVLLANVVESLAYVYAGHGEDLERQFRFNVFYHVRREVLRGACGDGCRGRGTNQKPAPIQRRAHQLLAGANVRRLPNGS